jgi:hypothetical protein
LRGSRLTSISGFFYGAAIALLLLGIWIGSRQVQRNTGGLCD